MNDERETRNTSFFSESGNVWEVEVEPPPVVAPEGGMEVTNVRQGEPLSQVNLAMFENLKWSYPLSLSPKEGWR
jgi:hypothetical protein